MKAGDRSEFGLCSRHWNSLCVASTGEFPDSWGAEPGASKWVKPGHPAARLVLLTPKYSAWLLPRSLETSKPARGAFVFQLPEGSPGIPGTWQGSSDTEGTAGLRSIHLHEVQAWDSCPFCSRLPCPILDPRPLIPVRGPAMMNQGHPGPLSDPRAASRAVASARSQRVASHPLRPCQSADMTLRLMEPPQCRRGDSKAQGLRVRITPPTLTVS